MLLILFSVGIVGAKAQETFRPNGVANERPQVYAFTNATIFTTYNTRIENATLLIENGKVKAVGTSVSVPAHAVVTNLEGKTIYPGFIDPYTSYGVPAPKNQPFEWGPPQMDSKKKGAYNWSEAIKAHVNASEVFEPNGKDAKAMRAQGFGVVNTHHADGIVRGTSALVSLADGNPQNTLLNTRSAAHYSFRSGTTRQENPGSLMGIIAVLRQTYLDAQWYANQSPKPFTDQDLMAFNNLQALPQIFVVGNRLEVLRAAKIGNEFGKKYIIVGNGDEYQRLNEIKATGMDLIVPVDFPDAYDVEDPLEAIMIDLDDMMHWEMAASNPARLAQAGINFSFTTYGLKSKGKFLSMVRKAVEAGLNETTALKALTLNPARMLRQEATLGNLNPGSHANFIVTNGNLFESGTSIYQNWVQGNPYVLKSMDAKDHSGNYKLAVNNQNYDLVIEGKAGKHKAKIKLNDSTNVKVKATFQANTVAFSFTPDKEKGGEYRLSGWFEGKDIKGRAKVPGGQWANFTATYAGALEAKEAKKEKETPEEATATAAEQPQVVYPFSPYGNKQVPQAQTMLFRNATVWTNEAQGIMQNADVLVRNGKIAAVGQNLSAEGATVVDATGKHLTSGIIDEHSHIAISRGVNEGSEAVTAEVRIGDVINSEDINIYRQLSGGVTAAQLLHGSANPIGGQSGLIKLRWGKKPEDMKIQGADGFIKFALGENVKQSNWGQFYTVRFPQSRMGVEQVMVDAFTRAREYEAAWKAYNGLSRKAKANAVPPRKDLELEALVEILNKQRFITCHSYVQSEINMLMKVGDRFGFTVNTFTHILEGYKVADKMAKHGAAGSTFADWWAYKFEVREAIPYNAAIMHEAGVTVAINSDDAEMGRRLNQEAAKAVKYGGMSQEDAWKTVTLNPAQMLHLDDHMGSIKVGKDADLVLWTDNPLSIYAKVEKTVIDGAVYFDAQQDLQKRQEIAQERARLTGKMRGDKLSGKPTRKPMPKQYIEWHCEHMNIFYHEEHDH